MIIKLNAPKLPFDPDAKIFSTHYECDCDKECIYPKQSYNEWLNDIESISSVNQEFIGPQDKNPPQ